MDKSRLEECRAWAESTDKHVHISGVRLPAGMATELVAEVERLNGRLQAVCDVLSDADAFDGVIHDSDIMEAVRGYRQATLEEVKDKLGEVVDDAPLWKWITEWKAVVRTDGTLIIDDLTGLFAEMSGLRD